MSDTTEVVLFLLFSEIALGGLGVLYLREKAVVRGCLCLLGAAAMVVVGGALLFG